METFKLIEVKVLITNIEWDLDDDDDDLSLGLPTKDNAKIKVDNYNGKVNDYDIEEAILDYLSDTYGFTVNSFKYKVISKK